jgi:hypothetical protein
MSVCNKRDENKTKEGQKKRPRVGSQHIIVVHAGAGIYW